MSFFERENLSVFLTNRKQKLLPAAALACIEEEYYDAWAPNGSRSIEGGDSFATRKNALWYGDSDTPTNILSILYDRIHEVVKHGSIFRIVEVGSGSYAQFITGLIADGTTTIDCGDHLAVIPDGEVVKKDNGLIDLITGFGFILGKHFEMIAVHGGEFRIEEQTGLKLITANIFDHIPAIKPGSVHLLFSFKTVYHSFGAMYATEYFDRLLARTGNDRTSGVGVVWPVISPGRIIFLDEEQHIISPETVFSMTGIGYWDQGSHAHWVAKRSLVEFPIYPRLLLKKSIGDYTFGNLVYEVDQSATDQYQIAGGSIKYSEGPPFSQSLENADQIIDISS